MMRNGHPGSGFFYVSSTTVFLVLLIIAIIAIIVLIFVVINLINKKRKNNKTDMTDNQKQTLENFESLVCSMLSQHGSGLKQYEISSNLGLPLPLVSEKLDEMEKAGKIIRKWENDDYTYIVKKCN